MLLLRKLKKCIWLYSILGLLNNDWPICRPQWTLTFWVNETFLDNYQQNPMSNDLTKTKQIEYVFSDCFLSNYLQWPQFTESLDWTLITLFNLLFQPNDERNIIAWISFSNVRYFRNEIPFHLPMETIESCRWWFSGQDYCFMRFSFWFCTPVGQNYWTWKIT